MKFLVLIILVILLLCVPYFFPEGLKIFGIPDEKMFKKNESDNKDLE